MKNFIKEKVNMQFIFLSLVITILTGCTSYPRIYSGESVHGWVIDAETKQPIEGVVVVEVWKLEGGYHTDHTANIHIAETVTDEEGYYSFSSWGPKLTVDGRMSEFSPTLTFYKFGYLSGYRSNSVTGNLNPDNSVSEHSGKKIELKNYGVIDEEYPKRLGSIYSILKLSNKRNSFHCMWKEVPVFTSEMVKAKKYFKNNGIYSNFPRIGRLSSPGCRNPEKFLKGYLE